MNRTTLSIIRRSINEFKLKSRLVIASDLKNDISRYREFNQGLYNCLYFNKHSGFTADHFGFIFYKGSQVGKCFLSQTSIEDLLLDYIDPLNNLNEENNKFFLGIYNNITSYIKDRNLDRRYMVKVFNSVDSYNIDTNHLYLFVRLVPTLDTSLLPMIMSINVPDVYCISNGIDNNINSIGFVCKLNDRQQYKYRQCRFETDSNDWNKKGYYKQIAVNFKYPFLTKKYINSFLFDSFEEANYFQYKIETNMLYMPTLRLSNKYNIRVISNF